MDWERSYFTMTDANISYIWGFLKTCQEREWLYKGHRSMPWCPRCGTSLSQHELIDSYREITHPSLFVRFPLVGRDHEYLAVWTTTPWTLPANVAAAAGQAAASNTTVSPQKALTMPFWGPGSPVVRKRRSPEEPGSYSGWVLR